MKIIIDDNTQINEIQSEFNNYFPFLKLEFFQFNPTNENTFSKANMVTNSKTTLNKIRHLHVPGYISLSGNQLVSTFEKYLKENFGINAQVFRKSGPNWLQTTSTDNWTLSEQNKKGLEMETIIESPSSENFEEYQEHR